VSKACYSLGSSIKGKRAGVRKRAKWRVTIGYMHDMQKLIEDPSKRHTGRVSKKEIVRNHAPLVTTIIE